MLLTTCEKEGPSRAEDGARREGHGGRHVSPFKADVSRSTPRGREDYCLVTVTISASLDRQEEVFVSRALARALSLLSGIAPTQREGSNARSITHTHTRTHTVTRAREYGICPLLDICRRKYDTSECVHVGRMSIFAGRGDDVFTVCEPSTLFLKNHEETIA